MSREEAFELFRQTSTFAHIRNRAHEDALRTAYLEGFQAGADSRDAAYKLRREGDPTTSHEAAEKVVKTLTGFRAELYEFLLEGPRRFTHFDVLERAEGEFTNAQGGKLSESTVRTRISELCDMGKVRDTGDKEKRPNGYKAIIWELVL